jgi:hypothetical protein
MVGSIKGSFNCAARFNCGSPLADKTLPAKLRRYAKPELLNIDEFGFDKIERTECPQAAHLRACTAPFGFVTPADMLAGRQGEIHTARDRKLEEARQPRQIRRQQAASAQRATLILAGETEAGSAGMHPC